MKKLSKAEKKRLCICTERAFDLLKRMEEMVDIFRKKEWPEAEKVLSMQSYASQTYRLLCNLDHKQYELEMEEQKEGGEA